MDTTTTDDDVTSSESPFGIKIGAVFSLVSEELEQSKTKDASPKSSPCSVHLKDMFENKILKSYKNRVRKDIQGDTNDMLDIKTEPLGIPASNVDDKKESKSKENNQSPANLDKDMSQVTQARPKRKRRMNKLFAFSEGSDFCKDYRSNYSKRKRYFKNYEDIISHFQSKNKMKDLIKELDKQSELDMKNCPYKALTKAESEKEEKLEEEVSRTIEQVPRKRQTARTKKKLWKCKKEPDPKNEHFLLPPKLEPVCTETEESLSFLNTIDKPPVLEPYTETQKQTRKVSHESTPRVPCSLSGRCRKPNSLFCGNEFELNMRNVKSSVDKKKIAEVKPMMDKKVEIKQEPQDIVSSGETNRKYLGLEPQASRTGSDNMCNEYSSMLSETFKDITASDFLEQVKDIKTEEQTEKQPSQVQESKEVKKQSIVYRDAVQALARQQNTSKFFQLRVGEKIVLIPTDGGNVVPKAFVMDVSSVNFSKSGKQSSKNTQKGINATTAPNTTITQAQYTKQANEKPVVSLASQKLESSQITGLQGLQIHSQHQINPQIKVIPNTIKTTALPTVNQASQQLSSLAENIPHSRITCVSSSSHPILVRPHVSPGNPTVKSLLIHHPPGLAPPIKTVRFVRQTQQTTGVDIDSKSTVPQLAQSTYAYQPLLTATGFPSTKIVSSGPNFTASQTSMLSLLKQPSDKTIVKEHTAAIAKSKIHSTSSRDNRNPVPDAVKVKVEVDTGDYDQSLHPPREQMERNEGNTTSTSESNAGPLTFPNTQIKSEDGYAECNTTRMSGNENDTEERIRKLKEKLKKQQEMVERLRKNMQNEKDEETT